MPARSPRPAVRVTSVDVLRGITIAGMILVNTAGDFEHVYRPLDHAPWDGLRLADVVFPFFVFVMGVSLDLALSRALALGATRLQLVPKIVRRTLILFALGLLCNSFPSLDLATIRIPGVLQRIALAYAGGAAVLLLVRSSLGRAGVAAFLVLGYEALLSFVPVPGLGRGLRTPEANLVGYLDQLVLPGHLLTSTFDPEGLLSTLPTIATALIGVLCGTWLREGREGGRVIAGFLIAGLACTVAGLALDPIIPVNKSLWSGTFVLVTVGLGMSCLALLHGMVDLLGWRLWALPFEMLGSNAIVLYVGSTLVNTLMIAFVAGPQGELVWKELVNRWLADFAGEPTLGSLLYAVAFLAVWTGVAALLWLRKIFIKI
ncbi:MAG TPA: heparan-alpha-glucosaminide N-acetyltransferase domain-containing protein [Myxococcota bacterium]|nr:heparan-alpha-glucosaminide N-acetyltransferase domain-containing protein [Myxococcota bacterium]